MFALGASCAFGLLFTPLVRGIAIRWNLCDKPNGRTSRGIAHIGGIAIIGAIVFTLIPIFLFHLPGGQLQRAFIPILIASGFLVFILGIIDDLRSLHYLYKFCLQVVVSLFVAFFGYALLERFGLLHLPLYLVLPTCFGVALWMLVVTTSFNLIDGLDGLASGLALIAAASYAAVGYLGGQGIVVALSLVLFGAVLGFLRYNFPPAKIFMGDSGSLFLGLLFGLVSLLSLVTSARPVYAAAGNVVILSVPILDTVLAFTRRTLARRPVMEADHRHIHHMLLYRFHSVLKADLVLWALAAVFACLGVFTMRGNRGALVSAVGLEVVVFVVALAAMVRIELPADVETEVLEGSGITASRASSR
jgi:UDP-GlcNAc:undecaprenyl-phosphate GlcNAc-1-phosphate transferase